MISRGSFWDNKRDGKPSFRNMLINNLKRRNWTLLLCAVSMFLLLPVKQAMNLSSLRRTLLANSDYIGDVQAQQKWYVQQFVADLGFSPVMLFLVTAFAVLFAVQGFAWQNSRRKLDLYLSVPVSARRRFAYIYLNGAGIFALCYLAALLLSLLTGAVMGALTPTAVLMSLVFYLYNMCAYLACYHLALLAVMAAGNVMTALLAAGTLFFYEFAVRFLLDDMRQTFFRSYCGLLDGSLESSWTSPLFVWAGAYRSGEYLAEDARGVTVLLTAAALFLAQAVVYGLLSYYLYRRRSADAAGRSLAFGVCRGPVKLLLLIPITLLAGVWFGRMSEESTVFIIIGMLLGLLLGHSLIQAIYDGSLSSLLLGKGCTLSAGLISAVIFAVFYFDLTGFDSYLPDTEQIESVSVGFRNDYYGLYHYDHLFEKEMYYAGSAEYMLEHMNDSDPEVIEAVREIAGRSMEHNTEKLRFDGTCTGLYVKYELKSGRKVYRSVYLDSEEAVGQMDILFGSEAFSRTRYQISDPLFAENAQRLELEFDTGLERADYLGDKKLMIETLVRDLKQIRYSMMLNELPVGTMQIHYRVPVDGREADYTWTYPVYESFTDTMTLLRDQGFCFDEKKDGKCLEPEDIISISITCYNLEENDVEYDFEGGSSVSYAPGRERSATFSEPEDIEKIIPALYPGSLADAAGRGITGKLRSENYSVMVVFAPGTPYQNQYMDLILLEEIIPDFVREKTEYIE